MKTRRSPGSAVRSPLQLRARAAKNASTFFLLTCFLAFALSFVRPRPQAFFRPDRRFPTPTRAEAVTAGPSLGHSSALRRFQGRALTASSTAADWTNVGWKWGGPQLSRLVSFGFPSRVELMSLPDPPFSTRSRVAGRTMGLQGFDAAMSRTHSTRDRCRKNRAVVEARPSRDSIPPRDAAKV